VSSDGNGPFKIKQQRFTSSARKWRCCKREHKEGKQKDVPRRHHSKGARNPPPNKTSHGEICSLQDRNQGVIIDIWPGHALIEHKLPQLTEIMPEVRAAVLH
jgi:hypothetical protein